MLETVVFVPSAPLLVPELSGPGALDTVEPRNASIDAVAGAARHVDAWVAVGASDTSPAPTCATVRSRGSFRGFGVDVRVRLDDSTETGGPSGVPLPLSMLIAGWLREQAGIPAVIPWLVAPDADRETCADLARRLAESIADDGVRFGVLVVADGSFALSAAAPGGGLRESAVQLQARIDAAIAAGDPDALAELPAAECAADGVGGWPAWQVVAELCRGHRYTAEVTYAAAPFGVGYTVATWTAR